MNPRNLWPLLLLAAILAFRLGSDLYHFQCAPAYCSDPGWEKKLPVDGAFYVGGAKAMLKEGNWVTTHNTFNSVAMQILVGLLFRVAGSETLTPLIFWNFLVWFATLALFFFCARQYLGGGLWPCLGVAILVSSRALTYYRDIVQYEVTVAFLGLVIAYLQSQTPSRARGIISGLLTGLLSVFRVHFVLFLPMILFRSRGIKNVNAWVVSSFLLIAVAFNLHYSSIKGGVFFFQSNLNTQVMSGDNSPLSTGANFPYSQVGEPHGWKFVLAHPLSYVGLLIKRVEYFTGFEPHSWLVESRWTSWLKQISGLPLSVSRMAFVTFAVLLFGWGVFVSFAHPNKNGEPSFWPAAFLFPVLTVLVPLLFINSTFRFLMPAFPCVVWFQLVGLRYLFIRQGLAFERTAFKTEKERT